MNKQNILSPHLIADLPYRLNKRLTLHIPTVPPISAITTSDCPHAKPGIHAFNLVDDMGNDLYGAAVITAALSLNNVEIDLPEVVASGTVNICKAS